MNDTNDHLFDETCEEYVEYMTAQRRETRTLEDCNSIELQNSMRFQKPHQAVIKEKFSMPWGALFDVGIIVAGLCINPLLVMGIFWINSIKNEIINAIASKRT